MEELQTKKELIDKTTGLPLVSASRLKLYQQCPKLYRYKYISEGIEKPSIYAIHGSALHKAIELWYKDRVDPYSVYKVRMEKWRDTDIQYIDQYLRLYSEGNDILKEFPWETYTPKSTEMYFKLKYPNDTNPICIIRGYLDMTTENTFIDFKSSKTKLSKKKIREDIQFTIYHWVFYRLYGVYPEYGIYYRLPDQKEIRVDGFDIQILDDLINQFVNDPMEYDLTLCDDCPSYCGLRQYLREQERIQDEQIDIIVNGMIHDGMSREGLESGKDVIH